jgi:hypothetical protein
MQIKSIQKKSSLFVALALCSQAYAADIYVDLEHTGTSDGSESTPFTSLAAAITQAKNTTTNPGHDRILLAKGRYQVPVVSSDLSSVSEPLTIAAIAGAEVTFDGTKSMSQLNHTGWVPLIDNPAIYKTTLTSTIPDPADPTNPLALLDEHIWQLFINDKMSVVARWPNVTVGHPTDEMTLKADGRTPADNTWWDLNSTWGHMDGGWTESSGDATMVNDVSYHDLAALGKSVAGGSVILNFHSETQFSRSIITHSATSNTFEYDRVKRPYDKGQGHFIIEHKNALDLPGEWYYDKDTREIWIWPEAGPDLNGLGDDIRGKVSTYAFELTNIQNLTIQGVTFFGTTISCKECDNVTIEGNTFLYPAWHDRMLGNHRIYDDQKKKDKEGFNVTANGPGLGDTNFYGSNYRIRDNIFAYSDAQIAMNRGSSHGNSDPQNNQVENNLFHHFSFTGMAHSILEMNANKGDSWQKNNTFHTHGSRAISKVAYVDVSMSRAYQWGYFQQDGVAWQAAGGKGAGGGSDGTVRHHLWVHDALKPAVRWDGFDGINGTDHHEVAFNVPGFGMIKGDEHQVYNNVGVLPHDPNETLFKILNTNEKWGNAPGDDTLYERNANSLVKNNLSASISGQRTGYLALTATDENNWNGYLKSTLAADQLRDPRNFDFRPKDTSTELINQGQVIAGITDDVTDGSPDIGAYEHGASSYWIPGFQYPDKATSPVPRLSTRTAKTDADLMWLKAKDVVEEKLYFGTSPSNMTLATTITGVNNIYSPGALIPHQSYYWRVDTKTASSGTDFIPGDVWEFTVEKPLAVTTQTVVVTEDVHVESAKPTTNLDGSVKLKVHTTDVGVVDKLAYLKFTVPTVVDSELKKVTLRLHRTNSSSTQGLEVYALADTSWNATTMTWDTRPSSVGALITTVTVSGATWQDIDVTAHVAEGDVAFVLGRAASTPNRDVDSAESAFAPELMVEHIEIDPDAPPAAPTGLSGVNELKGNRLTWDAVTNAVSYNVYRRITPEDFFVTPLNSTPITSLTFFDDGPVVNTAYQYVVKATASNDRESFDSNVAIITLIDADNDDMADSWESYYGLNPSLNDSASDFDSDGKTNLEEYLADTDPTADSTLVILASEDVYVRSDKATKNYEGQVNLFAKTTTAGAVERLSYVKFDVPADIMTATQVLLRVHRSQTSQTSGLEVSLMTDSLWDASTMTWDSRPADTGTLITTADIAANAWTDIDITGFITSSGEISLLLGREDSDTNRSIDAIESGFPAEIVIR